MTFQSVFSGSEDTAAYLCRPAQGRRPVPPPATPCARGALPGFLQARCASPVSTWTERGAPLRITGFDPAEDVLSLEFGPGRNRPELSFEEDEKRRVTTLFANGKPVAVLHLSQVGFSLENVAVTH